MAARARLCAAVPTRASSSARGRRRRLHGDALLRRRRGAGRGRRTLKAHRNKGLSRAAVGAALDAALAGDHELVFIVADEDDWPKELYAKLGFDPVGMAYDFTLVPQRDKPAPLRM